MKIDIIEFIKNPSSSHEHDTLFTKLSRFVAVFIISKIFDVLLTTGKMILHQFNVNTHLSSKYNAGGLKSPTIFLMLIVWIYIPIKEELAFRLSLRYTFLNVVVSSALIVTIVTKILVSRYVTLSTANFFLLDLFVFIFFAIIHFLFVRKHEHVIENWNKMNADKIVWFSIMIFSILHLDNLLVKEIDFNTTFLMLIEISRLALYGLFFSYLRMRNGLLWSILFHIVENVILFH